MGIIDDINQRGEKSPSTHAGFDPQPITLDKIRELQERIGLEAPEPMYHVSDFDGRGIPFRTPIRDEILMHPDDLPLLPTALRTLLDAVGIAVRPFMWVQPHQIVLTGNAARIMQNIILIRETESAMKEYQPFLDLLKRNGLL